MVVTVSVPTRFFLTFCSLTDRIIVVSEHFPLTLRNELERRLRQQRPFDEMELKRLAFTILSALVYLNQQNIVHRNLSLDNVLFDSKGCIKLSDYGLYYMTDAGANVPFPIGYTILEIF